jgi:hypothetical protein
MARQAVHGQEGTQVAARLVCTHLYLPTAVTKVLNLLVPVSMCCNSAERHLFNNTMTLKPVEAGNHGLLHLFSWRKYGILRQPSVRSHKWLLKMWRAVDWLVKSVLQERGQPIPVARWSKDEYRSRLLKRWECEQSNSLNASIYTDSAHVNLFLGMV